MTTYWHAGLNATLPTEHFGRLKAMMEFARYPSLEGKSVIVTGGASGIGAATVSAFAAQGAKVGFLDRDVDSAAALKGSIDGTVDYEICDLRDIEALRAGISALAKRNGPVTVLANNAARDDRHKWQEVTPEYWDERQATNIRHMFFAIQAVAPDMISAGGGSIINLGSSSWWEAQGGFPAYTTAKSAVHGLTRTMARDLGQHRIRVNTVVPGWIMTERQKELWATPEALEKHLQRQCLPDLIEPVYVARMIVFLASDDTNACTANNFFVDACQALKGGVHVVHPSQADVIFFSCFGEEHKKYKCKKVYYTGESTDPPWQECDFALTFNIDEKENHFRLPLWMLYIDWFSRGKDYVNPQFMFPPDGLRENKYTKV